MEVYDLIDKEKILLQQKEDLELEKIILEDEIKKVMNKMNNFDSEKDFYKKIRKEIISKYLSNSFQVVGTGVIVDVPFHAFSNNFDSFITSDYIVAGCVLYAIGLLTVDTLVELNNYKKNNNLNLKELEEKCEDLRSKLNKANENFELTISELDEIYKSFILKNEKIR